MYPSMRWTITDIISTLNAQQQVNFCKDPVTPILSYCATLNLAPTDGSQPFVNVQSFNLASVKTKGMDFEASYRRDLDGIGLPGLGERRRLRPALRQPPPQLTARLAL